MNPREKVLGWIAIAVIVLLVGWPLVTLLSRIA